MTVTPSIASEHGAAKRCAGALVFNVSQTVSDQTGLQTGDVIVQINRTPIRIGGGRREGDRLLRQPHLSARDPRATGATLE